MKLSGLFGGVFMSQETLMNFLRSNFQFAFLLGALSPLATSAQTTSSANDPTIQIPTPSGNAQTKPANTIPQAPLSGDPFAQINHLFDQVKGVAKSRPAISKGIESCCGQNTEEALSHYQELMKFMSSNVSGSSNTFNAKYIGAGANGYQSASTHIKRKQIDLIERLLATRAFKLKDEYLPDFQGEKNYPQYSVGP